MLGAGRCLVFVFGVLGVGLEPGTGGRVLGAGGLGGGWMGAWERGPGAGVGLLGTGILAHRARGAGELGL